MSPRLRDLAREFRDKEFPRGNEAFVNAVAAFAERVEGEALERAAAMFDGGISAMGEPLATRAIATAIRALKGGSE